MEGGVARGDRILLAFVTVWGGCNVLAGAFVEHTRPRTSRLLQEMKRGERVFADSSWIYTWRSNRAGLIESPSDVIDANFSPHADRRDVWPKITWLVGTLDTAEGFAMAWSDAAIARYCPRCRGTLLRHEPLRLDAFTTAVTLYQSDGPRQASIKGVTLRRFRRKYQ